MDARKEVNSGITEMTEQKELKNYQLIMELAQDAIFIKDLKSRYVLANRKAVEALGKESAKDVVGKDDNELLSPDHARVNIDDDQKVFKTGQPIEITKEMTSGGKTIYFQAVKTPIKDDSGEVVGLIGIARDITALKHKEDRLKESEEKYRNLVERTVDVIYTLDTEGKVTSVNKAVKTLLGLEPEQIIGRSFIEWVPKETALRAKEYFKQVLDEKELAAEIIMFDNDRKSHHVEFSSTAIIKDGEVVGVQGIVRDITERKKVDEKIKESESKFRTLFENAGGAIFVADTESGEILDCNAQAEELVGRARDGIIGMHQSKIHPKGEEEKYKKKFDLHIQKGHIVDFEGEVQHKDGRRIPICISAQTVKWGDKNAITGLFIDITDRKRAEGALKVLDEKVRMERRALREKNIALKEVMQQIEGEKKEIKHHILTNVDKILIPIVKKVKKRASSIDREYIDLLEKNLKEIISPFIDKLSKRYSKLSPREIEVCNLIKEGFTSKEIADLLNISMLTVHRYREYIRKKLKITNKKINLTSYLQSL